MAAVRIYAARWTGTRYHADPMCTGLNAAHLSNPISGVPEITWAEVRRRHLTPCRACHPPPLLTLVAS